MKTFIFQFIKSSGVITLLYLSLDFLQAVAPVSVYILLTLWAGLAMFFIRIIKTLSPNNFYSKNIDFFQWHALIIIVSSIGLYSLQNQLESARQKGILASLFGDVHVYQMKLEFLRPNYQPLEKKNTSDKNVAVKTEASISTETQSLNNNSSPQKTITNSSSQSTQSGNNNPPIIQSLNTKSIKNPTNPILHTKTATSVNSDNTKKSLDKNQQAAINNKQTTNEQFFQAIVSGQVSRVRDFLTNGISADSISTEPEFPVALFLAARSNRAAAIVKLLIQSGASLNKQSRIGYTALIKHVQLNRVNAIRLLLQAKANIKLRAKDGSNALYHAVKQNNPGLVKLLLKHKAPVNNRLHNGMTALIKAASEGYYDIAKLLVKNGADPEIRDRKGYRATDYAKWNGHTRLYTLLKANSGKSQTKFSDRR